MAPASQAGFHFLSSVQSAEERKASDVGLLSAEDVHKVLHAVAAAAAVLAGRQVYVACEPGESLWRENEAIEMSLYALE